MIVIRSDKFALKQVVNGLVAYGKAGRPELLYTPALKYVDKINDAVFIIDAERGTCEPTHGTLRRLERDKVAAAAIAISRQLNDESIAIPYMIESV